MSIDTVINTKYRQFLQIDSYTGIDKISMKNKYYRYFIEACTTIDFEKISIFCIDSLKNHLHFSLTNLINVSIDFIRRQFLYQQK